MQPGVEENLKVVAHMRDGKLIKGYLNSLPSVELRLLKQQPVTIPEKVRVAEDGSGASIELATDALKALFFVKSFEGRTNYKEVKFFNVTPEYEGLWVQVRYYDNEVTEGLVHNGIETFNGSGFLLKPPDPLSNNEIAYVLKRSLVEMRVLGVKASF